MSKVAYQPITVPAQFRATALRQGKRTALRQKKLGLWRDISWAEYYRRARAVAQGLLELGLQAGDTVAIAGENAPEWVIADMGIQLAGGVTVGIYTTSAKEQVAYILSHAGCRFFFAENEEQVDKFLHIRPESQVRKLIFWDEKGLQDLREDWLMSFAGLLDLGARADQRDPARLDRITDAIRPEDLSVLIYTSGTTGPPKGAMNSHRNLTWMGYTLPLIDPAGAIREGDEVLSYLPLCHIFERLFTVYMAINLGYTVSFVESPDTVPQNLREISPTAGYAVPRIWEKFYSTVALRMKEAKPLKRLAYRLALRAGERHADYKLAHWPAPLAVRLGYWLAEWSVFYFVKKRLGMERMRLAFSGAAPIAPDVLRFFHAIGLDLVEGYGLTECSGVATGAPAGEFRLGMVGKAIPGVGLRIAEDGEVLVKSPGVFMGYYRDPEATAAAIVDGWLHTGDVGEMDEDGYLRIIDRKKDLIITAGGKNIAPQYIENKLKFSPFIADAVIIGDRRHYLTAIIVLDEDNTNQYAQDHKIPYRTYADLATHPDILHLIQTEVDRVNKQLSRVESIRKFSILPKKLYEEDGEITPTMKVKRRHINETYRELIESMYAGG